MPKTSNRSKLHQAETFTGSVTRIFFTSDTFTTGLLKVEGRFDDVTLAGAFQAQVGDFITVTGKWVEHPKYGVQLKVTHAQPVQAHEYTETGLVEYLSRNPEFKGIGEVKARNLILKSGGAEKAVITIESAPVSELAKALAIPEPAATEFRKAWDDQHIMNAGISTLMGYGLSMNQAKKLMLEQGYDAPDHVKADPFCLYEMKGFGFKRCDDIARKLGVALNAPTRIRAGIHYTLMNSAQDGNIFLPWPKAQNEIDNLLQLDDLGSRDTYRDLAGDDDRLHSDDQMIALEHLYRADTAGLQFLKNRVHAETWVPRDYDHFSPVEALNPSQKEALDLIAKHSAVAIHGAAGTGKSYLIKVLTQVCIAQDQPVKLLAPTGKAARRISEMFEAEGLHYEAATIHRELGYNGTHFSRKDPFSSSIIIIDETSMVDSVLFAELVKWVPSSCKIVFVGDPNQLPPVGPGCPFHDMIKQELIPVHILDTVVRQAGVLKKNCTALLSGSVAPTEKDEEAGITPWVNLELTHDVIPAYLINVIRQLQAWGYDALQDVQIITPQHKTGIGTRALNESVQRYIQKDLYGVDVPAVAPTARLKILPGDKVIATRNDYELGYRNGDIGIALEVGREQVSIRMQGGKEISFPRNSDALHDFMLGYAITIHKAQGSEWPVVLAVISSQHTFMLSQALIYTAGTRAKERLMVLGDHRAKSRAVNSKRSQIRFTMIGQGEGGAA